MWARAPRGTTRRLFRAGGLATPGPSAPGTRVLRRESDLTCNRQIADGLVSGHMIVTVILLCLCALP